MHTHTIEKTNGHISAKGDPTHFMFCSRVGFQGRRIEWRYFRLHQFKLGGGQAAISDNFEWPYIHNGSFDPLRPYIARWSSLRWHSLLVVHSAAFARPIPSVRPSV